MYMLPIFGVHVQYTKMGKGTHQNTDTRTKFCLSDLKPHTDSQVFTNQNKRSDVACACGVPACNGFPYHLSKQWELHLIVP